MDPQSASESNSPEISFPAHLQKKLDERFHEFELGWISGNIPRIEDYLDELPPLARRALLRGLLAIEIEYRRDSHGAPLSEQQYLEVHPGLTSDLASAFQELRSRGTNRSATDDRTTILPPAEADLNATAEHTPDRKDSRGLHIRCPHCSNPVELLNDTPYDEVNCRTCGSSFSLVDRLASTRMVTPFNSIGRFDLVSRLGIGAFGTVWKARDRELDRLVAVKIPRRGNLRSAEIEQFYREARAAAQLRHPNIVSVHEVGREGETLFIVSDFVRGVTLSNWLTGRRPSPSEVAGLFVTMATALQHAHQQGVIHRDLKPSNIMMDECGQPHLMDFGLAKREVGEVTMTIDGQIMGTPAYMSPEQAGGNAKWTDRRTDIYALGVILFEMLAGELPFRGNAQMQVHQRLSEDAPDPRKLNRHIPDDLATICLKCLEREPNRRYTTAAELAAECQRFLNGEPILARPISSPARLFRWAKRKPMVATTAALTIFLAVAGPITALFIERQRSRLEQLVVEKNNLIDDNGIEKRNDTNTISDLRQQIDLWEGRANPWEFWPPKRDKPPRQQVLGALYAHATATLGKQLSQSKEVSNERARGNLALAFVADAAGRETDAVRYYELARDLLAPLHEQNPEQQQTARALAECYLDLARLVAKNDRAVAGMYLKNAASIRRQLVEGTHPEPSYQIEWLETELDGAVLEGFDSAEEHLKRVATINRSLAANLPGDSAGVYRLACFLTDREPVLADAATSNVP